MACAMTAIITLGVHRFIAMASWHVRITPVFWNLHRNHGFRGAHQIPIYCLKPHQVLVWLPVCKDIHPLLQFIAIDPCTVFRFPHPRSCRST